MYNFWLSGVETTFVNVSSVTERSRSERQEVEPKLLLVMLFLFGSLFLSFSQPNFFYLPIIQRLCGSVIRADPI